MLAWLLTVDGPRSAEQVTERVDSLIAEIRELHKPNMHGEHPSDVVLVSYFVTPGATISEDSEALYVAMYNVLSRNIVSCRI